jgi:hypothetical protein
LEYLPAGDAALTRRATKHSKIHAKVVRWSNARKRYERQGVLVEPAAIQRAEEECEADASLRQARRESESLRRSELDRKYIAEFASRILELFPKCPKAAQIAEHACQRYSGRVGRSADAKRLDSQAILLAVQAHVRHAYTSYDDLLGKGWDRLDARRAVREQLDGILDRWREPSGRP